MKRITRWEYKTKPRLKAIANEIFAVIGLLIWIALTLYVLPLL